MNCVIRTLHYTIILRGQSESGNRKVCMCMFAGRGEK
jgi:hypothetical protein